MYVKEFREQLISTILDKNGVHHEFASGMHGQKLDFDLIETKSELYEQWVDITADSILDIYNRNRLLGVIGVANGTNRLSMSVANKLGILDLPTYKVTPKSVALTPESIHKLSTQHDNDGLLIVLEDVGTTGSTLLTAINSTRQVGFNNVKSLITWQRTKNLGALATKHEPYTAIINEILPTYSAEDCKKIGFCSMGWQFIPRE